MRRIGGYEAWAGSFESKISGKARGGTVMPAPARAPRHAVGCPRLSEDVGGILRVVAQLASEPPHHIADHYGFAGPFRSPDLLQQLVEGQHPPGAADHAVRRLPEAVSQPVKVVKIQSSVQ